MANFLLWLTGVVLAVTLYKVFEGPKILRRSILLGALCGSLAGIVLGPLAIYATMIIMNALKGTRFLGLDILAGPILGPPFFAIIGGMIGTICGVRLMRRVKTKPSIRGDHEFESW